MAKQTVTLKMDKAKSKRPNIHSKSKTSKLKQSRNYKKKYKGQGR